MTGGTPARTNVSGDTLFATSASVDAGSVWNQYAAHGLTFGPASTSAKSVSPARLTTAAILTSALAGHFWSQSGVVGAIAVMSAIHPPEDHPAVTSLLVSNPYFWALATIQRTAQTPFSTATGANVRPGMLDPTLTTFQPHSKYGRRSSVETAFLPALPIAPPLGK